jgi:hypothetical protein
MRNIWKFREPIIIILGMIALGVGALLLFIFSSSFVWTMLGIWSTITGWEAMQKAKRLRHGQDW